jgi:ribosomal protein L11 methylase PrmA
MTSRTAARSSFRDNAGFVFFSEGRPYRHVNQAYREDFNLLKSSGLLKELHDEGLMIAHEEEAFDRAEFPDAIAVLKPEQVAMVSYPYEWSFSQLREAALCTLEIQHRAMQRGMSLKDSSAYNIQFVRGLPTLIDTLSLEKHVEGEPWVAYRQFCQHFLAPLALMANVAPEMSDLLRANIDGIPLELASKILPRRTKLSPGLLLHIHAHAGSQRRHGGEPRVTGRMTKLGLLGLIDSLRRTITKLDWRPQGTVWGDYYENTNYSKAAMDSKREIVREALKSARPRVVWDIGANTGEFSRIAAERAESVVAWDLDPAAVDQHYAIVRMRDIRNVLPLLGDLTNPSPALGWAHAERDSFLQRANADLVMALALVHHLAIGNNVPLNELARFFASIGPKLIVEFVPKSDTQVQRMLSSRKDIFPDYKKPGFERAFAEYFEIKDQRPVAQSERTIYSMERRAV